MAKSKSTVQSRKQDLENEKVKKYEAARKKLVPLPWIALALLVAVLLLNMLHWTDIYNTGIPGVEVSVNGFGYAAAGITGDYESTARIYGDLAVPFYYYTDFWCAPKVWCSTLSTLTLAAMGTTLVAIVLTIISGSAKKYVLCAGSGVLSLVAAGLYIACQSKAVSMKDGQILAIFCSNNPACSIRSFAIIPAIIAIVAGVFCIYIFIQHLNVNKLRN